MAVLASLPLRANHDLCDHLQPLDEAWAFCNLASAIAFALLGHHQRRHIQTRVETRADEYDEGRPEMTDAATRRRWFHFRLRTLLITLFCLVILFYAVSLIPASRLYCVKAEYSRLPGNDCQLEEWLKVQQGVVPHTVRVSRKGTSVQAVFIMVRNVRGRPSFPDLPKACDSLGYTGLLSAWTDDRDN